MRREWPSKIKLDDLCAAGREMGLVGIDLLNPEDFPTVKKYDLTCSMVSYPTIDGLGGIPSAWNRIEHHDKLVTAYTQRLQETADAGYFGQEFVPKRPDALASLRQAVNICDV